MRVTLENFIKFLRLRKELPVKENTPAAAADITTDDETELSDK